MTRCGDIADFSLRMRIFTIFLLSAEVLVTDSESQTPISYSSSIVSEAIWLSFRDMRMGQTGTRRQATYPLLEVSHMIMVFQLRSLDVSLRPVNASEIRSIFEQLVNITSVHRVREAISPADLSASIDLILRVANIYRTRRRSLILQPSTMQVSVIDQCLVDYIQCKSKEIPPAACDFLIFFTNG